MKRGLKCIGGGGKANESIPGKKNIIGMKKFEKRRIKINRRFPRLFEDLVRALQF